MCFWQKAKASHTLDIYTHKQAMPMQVFDAVQKIKVDQRRIKAANRSASKYQKRARKYLTSLRNEAGEQNSCPEGQKYCAGIAE